MHTSAKEAVAYVWNDIKILFLKKILDPELPADHSQNYVSSLLDQDPPTV